MNLKNWQQRIEVERPLHRGDPCIRRGTRIPISTILDSLAADGMTPAEVQSYYPQLSAEDIQAALAYNKAYSLMREFGKDLGEGRAPHDGAREHDRDLCTQTRKCRQFGSVKGMVKIADDFDEPLANFRLP